MLLETKYLVMARINSEYRALRHQSQEGGESKGWNGESLLRLYSECCRTREEPGSERVRKALRVSYPQSPLGPYIMIAEDVCFMRLGKPYVDS